MCEHAAVPSGPKPRVFDYLIGIIELARTNQLAREFFPLLECLPPALDAMPKLSDELCGQAYRAAQSGSVEEITTLIGRLNEFAVRAALGARVSGQC